MISKKIAGIFMVSLLAFSGSASALTVSASGSLAGTVCAPITHYLSIGSRDNGSDGDVSTLQAYLYQNGYLAVSPTGYFGPLTWSAVAKFQAANGVSAVGSVGPLTRALFSRIGCTSGGGGSTYPNSAVKIYSVSPTSGPVGTQISITGFGFDATGNIVHFGGGAITNVPISSSIAVACTTSPSCVGGIRETLVITIPSSIGPYCAPGMACPMYMQLITPGTYSISVQSSNGTSNTVSFTVTGSGTVPPPASAPSIYNINPSAGPVGTTVTIGGNGFTSDNTIEFGNGAIQHVAANPAIFNCPMMPVGSTISCASYSQTLTFTIPSAVSPACPGDIACPTYAQLITPGTYSVSVQNSNGTSNAVSFTVTGSSTGAPGPSISGIDAPASLSIGTVGVWTVHASEATNATTNLHYSVNWGDQAPTAANAFAGASTVSQSSATFTHAYSQAGTYTATFTVADDAGRSASVSSTISVMPLY